MTAKCALLGAIETVLFAFGHFGYAQTWELTSAPAASWYGVASSADGSKLVAVVSGGSIYTSTNSGLSWISNNAPIKSWSSVASSVDGKKLVAVVHEGPIYTSTNGGTTWISNNAPTKRWWGVASSADGDKLVAVANNGQIYTSTNSGTIWISNSVPFRPWSAVACSSDGGRLLAVAGWPAFVAPIYTSTDFGLSWSPGDVPAKNLSAAVSSTDGSKLVAAAYETSEVFISTNGGTNWTATIPRPNISWTCLAADTTGSKLFVGGCCSGPIYSSTNSGATWTSNDVTRANWQSIAASADGSKVVAVAFGGGIYTSHSTPAPFLTVERSGSQAIISWLVPSREFMLEINSDLSTTNWTEMPILPTLNTTNLCYEVTVSPLLGSRFYRLRQQ